MKNKAWPQLGCGVGLRAEHYNHVLSQHPRVDWFEAISENFMDTAGRPLEILLKIRESYPVVLHGVSLSVGSADPLNEKYLSRLKALVDRVDPLFVSDHLCWSGVAGESLHDLLPLPLTEEAADYVAERIGRVQDYLGRRILIENVSTYVTFKHSVMPEWEFVSRVARRAGCGILLDLNNIFVNSKNHGFDPLCYLEGIPAELVGQFHLAGHTDMGEYLFDTHSGSVTESVWRLYEKALSLYGQVSTLIEWDAAIPEFQVLSDEAVRARNIYDHYPSERYPKKQPVFPDPPVELGSAETYRLTLLGDQQSIASYVRPGQKINASISILNPQGTATGEERMSVYAGGYVARIGEALSEVFQAVKHLLGEGVFLEVVHAYSERYPSHEYNLSHAGKHLPDFFEQSRWRQEMPFLPDLARFEMLVSECFHAGVAGSFDPSILASVSADQWNCLRFSFQPHVRLFESVWPVADLWNARKTPLKEISVHLVNRSQSVLIYRAGFEVRCLVLRPLEYKMLKMLFTGSSLEESCGLISEASEETDLSIGEWFTRWTSLGILSGCDATAAPAMGVL